jgi:hypothetical protein
VKKLFIAVIIPIFLQISFADFARAQTDAVRLKDKRLLTSALKPGLNQYLVYYQNPKKQKTLGFGVWLRDIKVENRNGEKVFTINQHW